MGGAGWAPPALGSPPPAPLQPPPQWCRELPGNSPLPVDVDVTLPSLLSPHVQDSRVPPVPGAQAPGLVFIACAGGGKGRCHLTPNPPSFSLIKPVLLISGNERNLEVKLSSYAADRLAAPGHRHSPGSAPFSCLHLPAPRISWGFASPRPLGTLQCPFQGGAPCMALYPKNRPGSPAGIAPLSPW